MSVGFRGWLLLIAVALGSSACAKNMILREDASALSVEMATVQAQTRQFYTKLAAAQADFVLRVVADDPECGYYLPLYFISVTNSEKVKELRCATEAEKLAFRDGESFTGDMYVYQRPLDADYAALQLIALLAEYQAIMAQIVADPKIDFSADLDALTTRLDDLRERFGNLIGTGTDAKSPAFVDEKAAIAAVATLIAEARRDQMTVERLRSVVKERGVAVEDALRKIELRYRSNDARQLNNFEAFSSSTRLLAFNQKLKGAASEERLEMLRALELDEASAANQMTKTEPLAAGIEGLLKTHQSFRLALLEDKLTDDQRRRIADKTLRDLKAWIKAVGQIAVLL